VGQRHLQQEAGPVRQPSAARKAIWEEIQRWFWEEVPVVKLGDFFTLRVKQKAVAGYANRYRPFFWNVVLAR
jgi:ABC-type transport system substrate-binding protein